MSPSSPGEAPAGGFLFLGGGLGDVARRLYQTTTLEVLAQLERPVRVVCFSHNPAATGFFRYHPQHRHIVLMDMGHVYMSLLRDREVPRSEINQRIFALCGLAGEKELSRGKAPEKIGRFSAPDLVETQPPYVVVHPFGRGWGDWPPHVMKAAARLLLPVAERMPVYVIAADYIAADGRIKTETFPAEGTGIRVLKNLSAPAAFTLVAGATRFLGSHSALAQVAAFEEVPSLVLHPARCSDYHTPYSDYARTVWGANGGAMAFDGAPPERLVEVLRRFLAEPARPMTVRAELADCLVFPAPPSAGL